MQILTDDEIKNDIQSFQDMIFRAKEKLADLPGGHLPYSEHRKRELQRRQLEDEIKHVQKLIEIATEALNGQI